MMQFHQTYTQKLMDQMNKMDQINGKAEDKIITTFSVDDQIDSTLSNYNFVLEFAFLIFALLFFKRMVSIFLKKQ